MKAIVYNKKSLPSKLKYCDVHKPEPHDDEVLIKILASSINAADYRSLKMGLIPKKKIFGADIAGVVESIGKNILLFKPGDEIIGELSDSGFGGFAEYSVAPEKALILKPKKMSFEEAAALPMAAITALQALRKGNVQKGHDVLIVGSGGGVGTFAVQLAKYFETIVTAVCSTKNIEQTKALGADYIIDYTKEDFNRHDRHYDLIIAINGNYPLSTYKRILKSNGKNIMVGGALSQIFKFLLFGWMMSFGSKKFHFLAAKLNKNDFELIVKLSEAGIIKPIIDRRYPLDKTAEAFQYVSEGHARGKVVIHVP
jgi:NADPH:quinone reductase-like Zn-dependent oxidoreductase